MENYLRNYFKEHPVSPEDFMRYCEESAKDARKLLHDGKGCILEYDPTPEDLKKELEDKFAEGLPRQMGRKDRRLAEKRGRKESRRGKKAYSRAEIGKIKDDAKQQVLEYNVEALFTCFALAQNRLFGHDVDQISQTLEYIDGLMGEVLEDKITIEELKKELEEETGVRIEC